MNSLVTHALEARQALDPLAALYKASGDPLRLEILRVLRRETFGVLELCQLFDAKQSGMSHHLKVLARVGLVESQREGNGIFYRRPLSRSVEKPGRITEELEGTEELGSTEGVESTEEVESAEGLEALAIAQVFQLVDRLPLSPERQARIAAIRRQRSAQSQAFFARYADQFREQQELIADFEQYAGPVKDLIDARLAGMGRRAALEIGPGEGGFLPVLAERFQAVVAVDNSSEMLALASAASTAAGLDNVSLVRGEAGTIAESHRDFDLVVANMVLHHVPNPADIFIDVAALLAPGGRFVISELSSHNQNWVRPNCGDLWLGFEPEELITWASDAGLSVAEPVFLGLRNGFQIQVWEFSTASPTPTTTAFPYNKRRRLPTKGNET